ncbi:MAG: type II toxin-antitoxin system HicB family antitoxin [Patescibacteria group bacterium]
MRKNTRFTVEFERETDRRWIAEIRELPGVLCYGATRKAAQAKAEALALRVVAERLESGIQISRLTSVEFSRAS